MVTLTQREIRKFNLGEFEDYPVIAADVIYEGAAVGENGSGFSRPLVAGDPFQGFAVHGDVDNSAGAAGDKRVKVQTKGKIELSVVGVSSAAVNDRQAVYASDDNTFTLTATSNSLIGYISRWVSGAICVVEFDAANVKAALQA